MAEHAVASTELITNTEGMFVSIRNASATVNHVCNEVADCRILGSLCIPHIIPANKMIAFVPFSPIGDVITLAFLDITDLYIDTFESDFILTGVAEPAITLDW